MPTTAVQDAPKAVSIPRRQPNYRSRRIFGDQPAGTVFARHMLERAGDVDEMVRRNMVEETFDRVTARCQQPALAQQGAAAEAESQLDALTTDLQGRDEELATLKADNAALQAKAEELAAQVGARDKSLQDLSDARDHDRRLAEGAVVAAKVAEQDAKAELEKANDNIRELQKQLAALRTPAAPAAPKKAAPPG